jgi:YjbE family integral membrane protein
MTFDTTTLGRLIEIVWINILLSGDNAVVIALACHHLPRPQRKWGIILGTAPAVVVLIGSAAVITYLMQLRYLRLAGGVMLLFIAANLLKSEEEELSEPHHATSLWTAVRTIVVADVIMSLDNVLAIAAVAKGSVGLLAAGLAASVPLVIFGSALLVTLMNRFPLLVIAGATLIGYVAGDVAVDDPAVAPWLGPTLATVIPFISAAAVLPAGHLLTRLAARRGTLPGGRG